MSTIGADKDKFNGILSTEVDGETPSFVSIHQSVYVLFQLILESYD